MKRPAFRIMPVATFATAVAATILAAPLAQAQTDIEASCKGGGGEYSSQEVKARWGANATLIETCCTNAKCVTYRDGVEGPTYGGS
jgi:hypothetical protein